MKRILRKRIWRNLRENKIRYITLGLLIILGMYLVVSMVAAADTVIEGVGKKASENKVEDGEFSVFVPLTSSQENELASKKITLEKMFYLDYRLQDTSTIRVYPVRNQINLIDLSEGRMPEDKEEMVVEKRYASENGKKIGDTLTVGSHTFRIVGIGTTPDYDAVLKNMSDSAIDSAQFGTGFVLESQYEQLKQENESIKTEEYVYAYRLNGEMTSKEVKDYVSSLKFEPDQAEDTYFKEYYKELTKTRDELEEAVESLYSGSKELDEGLNSLTENNESVKAGAEKIFQMYLKEAQNGLEEYGLKEELTEDNFENTLQDFMDTTDNSFLRMEVRFLLDDLTQLKEYKDGVSEYADGVADATEGADSIAEGTKELKNATDGLLDTYFDTDISNLTQFIEAEDNPRIGASADDQVVNKYAGLMAGIIIMILFTYVISVFVIHGIERESSVIGALYALGVKKKELMIHYLTLPVVVTWIAGVIGTAIGFSKYGVAVQMEEPAGYFSLPQLDTVYSIPLLLYGLVMPPVIAAIVNYIVINKKLSRPALKMIRNEQKQNKISNINLGNMGFVGRFQIRQMLREARTGFTVIFGMFISMLVLMIGVLCFALCNNIKEKSEDDTKYEYMYTYKYPEEEVPEGGEEAYAVTLKKENLGYNLDVTVLGIDKSNPFFNVDVQKGMSKVIISSSAADKYKVSIGDQIILSDMENDRDYAFTVEGITEYSVGLYVFMDIDSMRELFEAGEDYYNVVFSDHKLAIDSGRLYSITSRDDIIKNASVFSSQMSSMVTLMIVVSIIIFAVVMYLMLKVMIDRCAIQISLMKIFGYRKKEVKKLYLNGNFYLVAVGAIICIPAAKWVMTALYPYMICNVAIASDVELNPAIYGMIYAGVIIIYVLINTLLVRRVNKMSTAEVLKNRE